MPQFSIKDLLIAITLVAIGLSFEFAVFRYDGPLPYDLPDLAKIALVFVVFGPGGAMIGAGLLTPFHKKAVGAGIGIVLVGAFFVLYALMGI